MKVNHQDKFTTIIDACAVNKRVSIKLWMPSSFQKRDMKAEFDAEKFELEKELAEREIKVGKFSC